MRILSKFKHMTLKRMIALLVLLFSLLPTLVMNIYAYSIAAGQAEARVEGQVAQTAQHVNSELNMVINEASRLMNYTSSYIISNFLNSKTPETRYENAKAVGEVFDTIRQTQSSNSYILDMSVIGINGHCFSERNGYFLLDQPFDAYTQFQQIIEEPRRIHVYGDSHSLRHQLWEEDALTVSAAVFKISTNEVCGILQVSVSKEFILNILQNARLSASGQTLIVDSVGTGILSSDGAMTPSKETVQTILSGGLYTGILRNSNMLIAYSRLSSTGWTILAAAPNHEIFNSVYHLWLTMVGLIAVSVLMLIVINGLLFKYVAKPISQLNALMQTATSGNLDIKIPEIDGQVEITELYKSFDTMLKGIKDSMNRTVAEQKNLKKAELKALQSQINPHFLYNTLDSAVWAAESNRPDEVIDLIAALSNFYRLTLSSGMDEIPFGTEVNHVSQYLHIMKMRYQDILDYTIDVAPDTLTARFPKIILQPIVENAIYHGIKKKRYRKGEKGRVEIIARTIADQFLAITVSDTGVGMNEAELTALRQKIDSGVPRPGQSYGLINVNMRLYLMFGDSYKLFLNSQPNCGTSVMMHIPLTEETRHGL